MPVKNKRGGKEEDMGSKQKQTHIGRKVHFERKLEDRLSFLLKKGIESPMVNRDTLLKKLRAHIRAVNARLDAIAANEKKTEELAKIKAEKAAAHLKEREGGKGKEKKEAPPPEEGKVKKKKPEKVESPAKEQEGSKVEKAKEASEEGKEKKKKKTKEETGAPAEPAAQVKEEK